MIETVRSTIEEWNVLRPGQGILVAVSGGPDSLALLECLYQLAPGWGVTLEVAHVDHGLRPDAARDAAFVEAEARRRGLSFHLGRVDAADAAGKWKTSIQDAAHRLRMEFLAATLDRRGLNWIATGHNLDDQAETVLLHFLRGAGPDGLSGMRPVDGTLIRPLLGIRREVIEQFCRECGLEPRIDPSNKERKYLRNMVRLDVIPFLAERVNPSLVDNLAGAAEIMADVSDLLSSLGKEALLSCMTGDDPLGLDRADLKGLHPALQREVVRLACMRALGGPRGLGRRHIEAVREMALTAHDGSRLELPGGIRAWVDGQVLIVGTEDVRSGMQDSDAALYEYVLEVPGHTAIPEAGVHIDAIVMSADQVPEEAFKPAGCGDPEIGAARAEGRAPLLAREVYIDYNKIDLPLTVRNRRPGDRFRPLNMGGSQKLKDFFIAGKIPPGLRDVIPLVFTGNRLVWVVGLRLDDRFKIDAETTSVVRLRAAEYRGV